MTDDGRKKNEAQRPIRYIPNKHNYNIKILSVGIFLFDIVYDNVGYIALFIIMLAKTFRSQDVSIRNLSFIFVELHIYLRIR